MQSIKKSIEDVEKSLRDFQEKILKTDIEKIIERIKSKENIYYKDLRIYLNNYDVMLEYFVKYPEYISYDTFNFKENEKFFLEAIKRPGSPAVNYWGKFYKLATDENIFKEVIKILPGAYTSLRPDLKENRKYNQMLIEEGADIFQYLDEKFQKDLSMVMLCLKNKYVPTKFFVHEDLKKFRDIFIWLANFCDNIPEYWISPGLLNDFDFVKEIKIINPTFFDKITIGTLRKANLDYLP